MGETGPQCMMHAQTAQWMNINISIWFRSLLSKTKKKIHISVQPKTINENTLSPNEKWFWNKIRIITNKCARVCVCVLSIVRDWQTSEQFSQFYLFYFSKITKKNALKIIIAGPISQTRIDNQTENKIEKGNKLYSWAAYRCTLCTYQIPVILMFILKVINKTIFFFFRFILKIGFVYIRRTVFALVFNEMRAMRC